MPANRALRTAQAEHSAQRSVTGGVHLKTERLPLRKVWIDLENSPHIPFFEPIVADLKKKGYQVVLTARDCFQVCELADLAGMEYRTIGRHYGKNSIAKLFGLAF